MNYILPIFLFISAAYIVNFKTREPIILIEIKERYKKLRYYIRDNRRTIDERFHILQKEILLTGFIKTTLNKNSAIGYNINKGYEIGLCIDGDANEIFHILIHELAHSVTKSYRHDVEFWENFEDLKSICKKCGVYEPIVSKSYVCGKYIQD